MSGDLEKVWNELREECKEVNILSIFEIMKKMRTDKRLDKYSDEQLMGVAIDIAFGDVTND